MVGTILLFLAVIVFLVLVHELGHYLFARRFGITVEEFGIGFPPRLFSWQPKGSPTVLSINLIPLGGFVRLKGEEATDPQARKEPGTFAGAPYTAQALVLVGGVLMNVLAGLVLYSVAYAQGILVAKDDIPSHATVHAHYLILIDVLPESPATQAGLKPGDRVVRIVAHSDDTTTSVENPDIETFVSLIQKSKKVELTIVRGGKEQTLAVTPREGINPAGGRAIGVIPLEAAVVEVAWWRAPWEGLRHTIQTLQAILFGFWTILMQAFQGADPLASLTGPVGIAALVGEARDMGVMFFIPFVALISLNLAVLNLLPIPALDGGRLLLVLIEALVRRPIPPRVAYAINAAGFAFLVLLAALVTYNDIVRLTGTASL